MKISVSRTLVTSCCLCVLALSWLALPAAAARHVDTKAAPDFAQIDAYVNAQMQDARIPGLALAHYPRRPGGASSWLWRRRLDGQGGDPTDPVPSWLDNKVIYRTGDHATG